MENLPTQTAVDQTPKGDTPKDKRPTRRTSTAWVTACAQGVATCTRRRLPGGWKRIPQGVRPDGTDTGQLAADLNLYHPDGTPYSARHIRSGLLDAERARMLEIRRGQLVRDEDGTIRRADVSCYRVVSAKRRRAAEGKQAAPSACAGVPVGSAAHPSHQTQALSTAMALSECVNPDCRDPYRGPPGQLCRPCRSVF